MTPQDFQVHILLRLAGPWLAVDSRCQVADFMFGSCISPEGANSILMRFVSLSMKRPVLQYFTGRYFEFTSILWVFRRQGASPTRGLLRDTVLMLSVMHSLQL